MIKYCPKCETEKDINDFVLDKKTKDGHYHCCKECKKSVDKQYRGRTIERRSEYFKRYYNQNDDRLKAKMSERYKEDPEKYLKQQKDHYLVKENYIKELFYNIGKRLKYAPTYKHRKLYFTLDQFLEFAQSTEYEDLYNQWQESGYKKKYAPSVDRIDNNGDYTLDNIQVITHGENSAKRNKVDYAKTN